MSATIKSNPLYFDPNQPKDKVEMQQLWKVMDDLNSLAIDEATALQAIATIVAGSVQSVTGLDTDNIDPRNPVIQISVDGVTITGLGTPASPLAASGGGEDLDQTLTIGNDGGGQDIVNVAGLQDSSSIRSIDIEHRQLINDNGLLWTIDWNNRMTADTSGQTSIDWENRELTDSALTPIFDWENFAFPTLAGGGTQMLTVDNTGAIGAQAIGGGEDLQATLALGNTTSGTDIEISTGDFLVVDDATPSEIAGFSASSELISLPVATYPSLTELAYVKGVTSAIQTQLDAKVFTIDVKMLSTNLADGITYFIGNIPQTPITASIDRNRIDIPYNCTLVGASIMFSSFSAVGTNENISIYVRVNNTTDHLVATIGAATADRLFENMGLSVALTPSDYIHVKIVCPTWATNPTQTVVGGILYFKIP